MTERELTAQLSTFVIGARFEDLNDVVIDRAKKVVVDTLGSMLAGVSSDTGKAIRRYAELPGTELASGAVAWVGSRGKEVAPELAALVSGTLGHALDYDDVLLTIPGHPSAVVLAAALAAAPEKALTGCELMLAYVVGVEVASALGRALGNGHYKRGWHATSTASIFGAAAAASKILRLDPTAVRRAFGIAASCAAGLQRQFGTMTKPLHSGLAARNGLFAAQMASVGYTSNTSILEVDRGFLAVYGDDNSGADNVQELGHPFVLESPGVALKKYPCCGAMHRAIDATLDLRDEYSIAPKNLDAMQCFVPPGALHALLYKRPIDGLQAKFSMEYNLAAAIVDGTITLESFRDAQVTRSEVHGLYERITVTEDPLCAPVNGRGVSVGMDGFIRVTCRIEGGRVATTDVTHPRGSPERELTWAEIESKFRECTDEGGFDRVSADGVFGEMRGLEHSSDIRRKLATLV